MPEKKKNEMTYSDRFKSLYFDSSQENLLLKGGRTHRLSIGGVTLEIVPSSKMSPKQVFNMYIKFLKELKDLHGDKHLLAPKDGGNSGDFRSRDDGGTLAAPSGNPNYSNVSNATRHYTRWFQNTSGGSKTDFSITINGTGTIVSAGTSLSGGNNLRVACKIPRTSAGFETGWMDLATAFSTGENGDDAGCLVGSLDSSLNASNDATFGTQSVGANEYILVRIIADKTWTGNITDITISWS